VGSQIVQTPCGPIEYALAGSGPPLLMIHGAGGGFDQGLKFGAPLARAGFTVIAPSRFGYLRTPLSHDASPAAQADAHACLLDALGLERVVALGGSAGAPSAIQFCLQSAALFRDGPRRTGNLSERWRRAALQTLTNRPNGHSDDAAIRPGVLASDASGPRHDDRIDLGDAD